MINCYTPRKCPSVSLSMNALAFLLHSNHFCHFWSKVPKFSLSFCSPCQIIQNGKVQQWEVCTSGPKGASFSFGSEKQNHHCTFMRFKPASHAGNVDGNCVLVLVSSYEKIFGYFVHSAVQEEISGLFCQRRQSRQSHMTAEGMRCFQICPDGCGLI